MKTKNRLPRKLKKQMNYGIIYDVEALPKYPETTPLMIAEVFQKSGILWWDSSANIDGILPQKPIVLKGKPNKIKVIDLKSKKQ